MVYLSFVLVPHGQYTYGHLLYHTQTAKTGVTHTLYFYRRVECSLVLSPFSDGM